jgi:hypothetical protein
MIYNPLMGLVKQGKQSWHVLSKAPRHEDVWGEWSASRVVNR